MSQDQTPQAQVQPEAQAQPQAAPPQPQPEVDTTTPEQHLTYAIVAIVVGFFCLGAIAGWVACYHGSQCAEKAGAQGRQDMQTAGTVVQWIGVVEAVVMGLYILSLFR